MTFRKIPQWLDSSRNSLLHLFSIPIHYIQYSDHRDQKKIFFFRNHQDLILSKDIMFRIGLRVRKEIMDSLFPFPPVVFSFTFWRLVRFHCVYFPLLHLWGNTYYVEPYKIANIQPVLIYKMAMSHGST